MATVIKAVWENGVFKPEEPVELAEHAQVELVVQAPEDDDPTGWKAADELIGFIKGGPAEPIGDEHDRYLYGDRRR